MTAVDDRLLALETAEQARDAIAAYCRAVDTNDLALLRETLSENVVLNRPPDDHVEGCDAVVDFFAAKMSDPVDVRKHMIMNPTITVRPDGTAAGHVYFLGWHFHTGKLGLAMGGYQFTTRPGRAPGKAQIDLLRIDNDIPLQPLEAMMGRAAT